MTSHVFLNTCTKELGPSIKLLPIENTNVQDVLAMTLQLDSNNPQVNLILNLNKFLKKQISTLAGKLHHASAGKVHFCLNSWTSIYSYSVPHKKTEEVLSASLCGVKQTFPHAKKGHGKIVVLTLEITKFSKGFKQLGVGGILPVFSSWNRISWNRVFRSIVLFN